jgi:hypothetical protein
MPLQLFVFLQLEFPWALGPADGRYLLRNGPDAEPERVVVLETLTAGQTASGLDAADAGSPGGWLRRRVVRERPVAPQPDPTPVQTTRVTVIDPVPLSAEIQAKAWLDELDRDRDIEAAVAIANRVVHYQRLAAADPYAREVSHAQALTIRAGWGEGEQVASGLWLHARELSAQPRSRGRRRDRSWALRPQERLAALLGGRNQALLCEELVLRARLDLDQGRSAHAALGLDRALVVAVPELTAEQRQDLTLRIAELDQLRSGVADQARAVLEDPRHEPDPEAIEHALGRLEAALRARTASGV